MCLFTMYVLDIIHQQTQMDLKTHPDFLAKCKCVATKVGPSQLLSIPWGWAVCECTLNNTNNAGLRWTDVRSAGTPGLNELIKVIAPKPDEVKANTSTALLLKIVKGMAKAEKFSARVVGTKGDGKGHRL